MYFILYPVKRVPLRGKIYPPRYLCVIYGVSLKAARFQQTAYFFFPSTHSQLLLKMETRPLTVVEHVYRKVEYIELIVLTLRECFTCMQKQVPAPHLGSEHTKGAQSYRKSWHWENTHTHQITLIKFHGQGNPLKCNVCQTQLT